MPPTTTAAKTETESATATRAETGPGTALAFPPGRVTSRRPGGAPYNIPWAQAARWEPRFSQAAAEFAVNPRLLVAMAILESDANHYVTHAATGGRAEVISVGDAHPQDGPSVGIMQVKPQLWQAELPDADAYTPRGNIRLGAYLMKKFIGETGSWQEAIRLKYHPGTSPGGVTPQTYVKTIKALLAELREAADGRGPAPARAASEEADDAGAIVVAVDHPLDIIAGGVPWTAGVGFGTPILDGADRPLDNFPYGVGHGTTAAHHHPGIDIELPLGTLLHTPLAGVVRCVGDQGDETWGQGCEAYADALTGGVGTVTVLTDVGLMLTFGHVNRPLVAVGERVAAGQPVATSGGLASPCLHLEAAVFAPERVDRAAARNGGDYVLVDPVPALRRALGGAGEAALPCVAAPPPPFDGTAKTVGAITFHPDRRLVEAALDGLACRRFATLDACLTRPPLARGERVRVLFWVRGEMVAGEDRWWVAEDGGRIWSGGTRETPHRT